MQPDDPEAALKGRTVPAFFFLLAGVPSSLKPACKAEEEAAKNGSRHQRRIVQVI
jgi:hypothetical protein